MFNGGREALLDPRDSETGPRFGAADRQESFCGPRLPVSPAGRGLNFCQPPALGVSRCAGATRSVFGLAGRGAEFHVEFVLLRPTGSAVRLPKDRGCALLFAGEPGSAVRLPKFRGCALLFAGEPCSEGRPNLLQPALPVLPARSGAPKRELPSFVMPRPLPEFATLPVFPPRSGVPKRALPSFANGRALPEFT